MSVPNHIEKINASRDSQLIKVSKFNIYFAKTT